jgi:negative regulator of sigma E activity
MRFGPDELGQAEGNELVDSLETIRSLESVAADANVRVGTAFTDRVMAALADEPTPTPAGFLAPLRRRGLVTGFVESLRQAWRSMGAGRPVFARAAALAYVLAVVLAGTSLAGAATFGAAGALGLLDHETSAPSVDPTHPATLPTPRLESNAPESAEPTETPEPSEAESAEPSDDHGGGPGVEPSDDHGGSGPGAEPSDDHSGSGGGSDDGSDASGDGSAPSATDEHSGSGGTSGADD